MKPYLDTQRWAPNQKNITALKCELLREEKIEEAAKSIYELLYISEQKHYSDTYNHNYHAPIHLAKIVADRSTKDEYSNMQTKLTIEKLLLLTLLEERESDEWDSQENLYNAIIKSTKNSNPKIVYTLKNRVSREVLYNAPYTRMNDFLQRNKERPKLESIIQNLEQGMRASNS